MKVLHFYSGNFFGGLEKALINMHEYRDHMPTVSQAFALCFRGRLWDELVKVGAEPSLVHAPRLKYPWSWLVTAFGLSRVIVRTKPDVVIYHEFWCYAFGALVGRLLGRKVVFWCHSASHSPFVGFVKYVRPDLMVTCSRFAEHFWRQKYPGINIIHHYYPVPAPDLSHARQIRRDVRSSQGVDDEEVVILFAGRMSPYKGQVELLEALPMLDGRYRVWIVGAPQDTAEGEFYAKLKDLCRERHTEDKVFFLGFKANIYDYFLASDIFCHPNNMAEPFGIVFVEALYCSLPVVTTDIGGGREILLGENVRDRAGLLVVPGSCHSLSKALQSLLSDSELRKSLGRHGPVKAQAMCSPASSMEGLEKVITNL